MGWRSSREIHPLSAYLGALGMTGMTAWAGLRLVEVRASETVFISGAAGAVGSVGGQLAKLRGCRVIGSVGSDEKVRFLKEECGFDSAFNKCQTPGSLLQRDRGGNTCRAECRFCTSCRWSSPSRGAGGLRSPG